MSRVLAVDFGTMFFQVAEKNENKIDIKITRNSFVELEADDDTEQILHQNNWQYIKDGKKYYIIGEDSLRVAKMFPGKVELRRPMQNGILNKGEEKKILVLSKILEDAVGKATDSESLICFCISSEAIDTEVDSIFHRSRIEGMIKRLGYKYKVIEEGYAIILAERPVLKEKDGEESPYSGIGISFGAGKVNCVMAYKGLPVIGLSATRSGDWIDKKVSEQTDTPIAQVISIKENKLDFDNIDYDDDIIFALNAYYDNMIEYIFKNFAKRFSKIKSKFDMPLDIIIAGGTSMPNGFENKVKEVVEKLNLPFKIKNIIKSKNPRNSVVTGCLTSAILAHKKIQKKYKKNEIDEILED